MTQYSKSSQWIHKTLSGGQEAVLIPLASNKADMTSVFVLNETGSFLWEKLETQSTLETLESELQNEFDCDPKLLQSELKTYLADLVQLGAIEIVS
jgi:hypothetical protein